MKTISFIVMPLIAVFIAFSKDFYRLWLPFKSIDDISFIYSLSMIVLTPIVFLVSVLPLLNLNNVSNLLKRPCIANLIMSSSILIAQLIFLKFSDFGLYALVISAAAGYLARIVFFDIINAALNLDQKISTFYPIFIKNILVFCIVLLINLVLKSFTYVGGWGGFFFFAAIFALGGYIAAMFMFFSKSELKLIKNLLFSRLKSLL